MVQDKTEEKRIFLGVGVLTFLFVFKLKNRSKPSRMKAVRFPTLYEVIAVSAIKDGDAIVN